MERKFDGMSDDELRALSKSAEQELTQRAIRARESRMVGESFTCPLSVGHPFEKPARWEKTGADLVCSFCGSWHPDEFAAHCERILAGQEPACSESGPLGMALPFLSVADSRVKIYVRRAGVPNAGAGAIKVRTAHMSDAQVELANRALRFCCEKAARSDAPKEG